MPRIYPSHSMAIAAGPETPTEGRDSLKIGWRVLALLQFAAAGSLVLALASQVLCPNHLKAFFVRAHHRTLFETHRTVCTAQQSSARQRLSSKNEPHPVLRPSILIARLRHEEPRRLLILTRIPDAARAPPVTVHSA